MKDKIAKKILKMEKDKLMSKPESDRDWELITALDIAIKALEERPTGEWILIDDVDDPLDRLNRYKCSECGRIIRIYDHQNFPFCHCGADMRGEDEEEQEEYE